MACWLHISNKAGDLRDPLRYEGFEDNNNELKVMILYLLCTCSTLALFTRFFMCTSGLALCSPFWHLRYPEAELTSSELVHHPCECDDHQQVEKFNAQLKWHYPRGNQAVEPVAPSAQ